MHRAVRPEQVVNSENIFNMSYKSPWHSKKPNTPNVYHNNDKCTEGNNIESYYLVQGTGGRPLCKHCERLNKEGK